MIKLMEPQYPDKRANPPSTAETTQTEINPNLYFGQVISPGLNPFNTEPLALPVVQTPVQISGKTKPVSATNISKLLFRLGFASIFLVNSLYAALRPSDFTELLYANPLTNSLGYTDTMVKAAMVNDLLLGVLILCGWRKKLVFAWAGVWLLMVTGIKTLNLFFN